MKNNNPWFAGLYPHFVLSIMVKQPDLWGSWLCLTDDDAQTTMMMIEMEAQTKDLEVQMYLTRVHVNGPGMDTPAWSIAVRTTSGQWQAVQPARAMNPIETITDVEGEAA